MSSFLVHKNAGLQGCSDPLLHSPPRVIFYASSKHDDIWTILTTRHVKKKSAFRVLDLIMKISHFEYSKVDLVSGRSNLFNEHLVFSQHGRVEVCERWSISCQEYFVFLNFLKFPQLIRDWPCLALQRTL